MAYQIDLTGDGYFGDKVEKSFSKFENTGLFKAESGALVISSASSNVGDYFQTNRVVLSEKWLETPLKLNSEQLFLVNYYADHTPYELSSIYGE